MSTSTPQVFSDQWPGAVFDLPNADADLSVTFTAPDSPMPPAGVQYCLLLLRIAGVAGLPRGWELLEVKLGPGGLVVELDGHGSLKRLVEPLKAAFHPQPGQKYRLAIHYEVASGHATVIFGNLSLLGTSALRAGARPLSVELGVPPGHGGPALQYPHGWQVEFDSAGLPTATVAAPPAPAAPAAPQAPAQPPVHATPIQSQEATVFADAASVLLSQHGHDLSPEEHALLGALIGRITR